jgi:hypothetical protein
MVLVKAKKTLMTVEWREASIEEVPIVSATPLEILAVGRLLRFARQRNPNNAKYSPVNPRVPMKLFLVQM